MFLFSAEDVRNLKNRVASLEAQSAAASAHTSRLSGSSNDINAYMGGGGTSHTNTSIHLAGGGGGSSSRTQIDIAAGASGSTGGNGNGNDISLGGGASGSSRTSAGAGSAGTSLSGSAGSSGTRVNGGTGSTGARGSAGSAGTSYSGGAGTTLSGSSGTSYSGSAGTGYSGGAGSAGTSFSGGTGVWTGMSGEHLDAASLRILIHQMLRTEMQSQAFRGVYLHTDNTKILTHRHTVFLFTELLFSVPGFLASSVQVERGPPGPKGDVQI